MFFLMEQVSIRKKRTLSISITGRHICRRIRVAGVLRTQCRAVLQDVANVGSACAKTEFFRTFRQIR